MMGVISESERGIENMINNLGVADTIKYMGGYNDSMKKYITNENKIDFIKDMVQHLSKPYNTIGISIYELGLNPVPYSISGDEVQQIEYFGPESAVIDVYYEGYHKSDFEEKYKNFDNHTLNDVFLFMLDTLNYYK
jgi:hypothetical protein